MAEAITVVNVATGQAGSRQASALKPHSALPELHGIARLLVNAILWGIGLTGLYIAAAAVGLLVGAELHGVHAPF